MSIKCEICSRELPKQITNTHLKTHGISTAEYKAQYGEDSLSCSQYRKELSERNSGKNNPNYNNKWSDEQKNAMAEQKKGNTQNTGKHARRDQAKRRTVSVRRTNTVCIRPD